MCVIIGLEVVYHEIGLVFGLVDITVPVYALDSPPFGVIVLIMLHRGVAISNCEG